MLNNKKIKVAVILGVLMSASILALAIQHRYFSSPKKLAKVKVIDSAYKPPVYNPTLLARFESLCKKYDTVKENYTLAGSISMVNKADTSGQMNNVRFLCCKEGNAFYYLLGQTETINAGGLYIFIDHANKKIMLGQQKGITFNAAPKSLAGIGAALKGEDYQLRDSRAGAEQTISMINERHPSCREYSVSFDTLRMQIKRIYIRLGSYPEPVKKGQEQVIDIRVSTWNDLAELNKYYLKNSIVKKENDEWKPTAAFADYELIKML